MKKIILILILISSLNYGQKFSALPLSTAVDTADYFAKVTLSDLTTRRVTWGTLYQFAADSFLNILGTQTVSGDVTFGTGSLTFANGYSSSVASSQTGQLTITNQLNGAERIALDLVNGGTGSASIDLIFHATSLQSGKIKGTTAGLDFYGLTTKIFSITNISVEFLEDVTITNNTSNALLTLETDNDNNEASLIQHTRGGSLRWSIGSDNNVGVDDYSLFRYNNSGVFQDNPFIVRRATGVTEIISLTIGGVTAVGSDYGHMGFSDSSTTLAMTQNVYSKVQSDFGGGVLYTAGASTANITILGDSIQVTDGANYLIEWNISLSGANADMLEFHIFINNILVANKGGAARGLSSNKMGNIGSRLMTFLTPNSWISLRIRNTANNNDVTMWGSNIIVQRL